MFASIGKYYAFSCPVLTVDFYVQTLDCIVRNVNPSCNGRNLVFHSQLPQSLHLSAAVQYLTDIQVRPKCYGLPNISLRELLGDRPAPSDHELGHVRGFSGALRDGKEDHQGEDVVGRVLAYRFLHFL